ncbi:MAG: YajQ family cyclic di-GMP-binding protein [Coriobacteriia bacterium]|nr:YajQ family cyclic di-GMP-binding protein [Coriobacteriia bacterium]
MAKDSSFDIVSQVDLQEVDNAYNQATRELAQRYDLKDSGSTLEFDKGTKTLTLTAPSDFVAGQIKDILGSKLVRRDVDLKAVRWGNPEDASGMMVRYQGTIVSGIDDETIKRINKDIKAEKFKAKTQIEGDKIRVSSPSRDTLQDIIAFVKQKDYDVPLQFINYR